MPETSKAEATKAETPKTVPTPKVPIEPIRRPGTAPTPPPPAKKK